MPEYKPGTIQIRRYSTAKWASLDPVLVDGELGYDTDTGALKVGDGHSHWSELATFAGPEGAQGEQGPKGDPGALSLTLADDTLVNTGTDTNPVLKVGDLSSLYASAAQLSNLSAQQAQLMGVAATIDELTVTAWAQGVWSAGTYYNTLAASTPLSTFWVAPYACTVTACQLIREYTDVAKDATNYLTVALYRMRAGTYAQIVAKSTADEALTARTAWDFANADWDTGNAALAKGDGLAFGCEVGGTTQVVYPLALTCQVQPS